jgi:dCTP deaminase
MNILPNGAVLTRETLVGRIASGDIVISPLLEDDQIGDGSVDIRLGTQFIVNERPQLGELDPAKITSEDIRRYQRMVVVPFDQKFTLHPGSFSLGCTFEFISLPNDVAGFVLSRSRYGRAGLLIATATYVHPGWKGCLTLELENLGEVPIGLRPGSRVGQLVLLRAERIADTRLKSIPVGPTFTSLEEDPRWTRFSRK